ncbi:hypothetical protein PV733_06055 [Streptomyces europaeiscabiei]|uniref:hypothetical protein n=1 Tax=Streptomyces europaeiscabiei TaxID=146819 RepID=UPI0029AE481F|nr:hypothetical protein [Streptomyces europaeiscabiei]MDX3708536.1 hypothetical protein [Streptomyces europaeiscabiei]
MADEQYRWLNRDAAERLLRGEPLETVDADTRARADRLTEALEALAAEVAPVSSQNPELPGEEAALAAFRTARTARSVRTAASGVDGRAAESGRGSRTHTTAAPAADAGLVRLGRPLRRPTGPDGRRARWGRPVRFGLVAAVAAGMLGGVTVVAGGGALSAFHDDEPEPSATISAAQSPDQPLLSPSPNTGQGDSRRGAWGEASPEVSPDASSKGDGPSGEGAGGTDEDEQPGGSGQDENRTQEWWDQVFSACRDVRDGKQLDADRRRGLEDAAGGKGKGQLKRYCEGVLAGGGANPGTAKRPGTGAGTGASDSGGPAGGGGKNARSGIDSDEDDDSDNGKGRHGNGNGKGRHGNGNGKSRHGNGNGSGNGLWHGNGKNKAGKGNKGNKGNKGGKGSGSGGSGHHGRLAAVNPIGFGAGVGTAPSEPVLTHPS